MPPPPNGTKPEDVDLTDPGPDCCPVVWASLSAGNEDAFCTAKGKPGHGKGGTAHAPPSDSWRRKYVGGLMCLLASAAPAPGSTASPPPPSSAWAPPSCFSGAAASVHVP